MFRMLTEGRQKQVRDHIVRQTVPNGGFSDISVFHMLSKRTGIKGASPLPRNVVVNEERMRPGHWFTSVL